MTAIDTHRISPDTIIVESSPGVVASRRAGNLWTTEARDDMFNRRERGEGWESICQDYPNRSRHAMQQQYSMMKKQRMMEAGTWTTNRRGRKRKVLPTVGNTSVGGRRESGLETTEDEFASVTPSDLEPDDPEDVTVYEIELGTPAPESNGSSGPSQSVLDFRPGRPSGLSRSATDPAPAAPRGRGRGRGRMASSAFTHADASHPPLAPKGFTPVNEDRESRQLKRGMQDNATPPAAKRQKSQAETPSIESQSEIKVPFSEPAVFFSKDDISLFVRKGLENGERAKKALEEEFVSKEKSFQDAQGRANRRAYEAEEKIKEMGYRHRSDIRQIEHGHAEKMENMQYDYEQKMEELKKELAQARGVDVATLEATQQQQQQQQQAPPARPVAPPAPAVTSPTAPSADSESQLIALVNNLEELKGRFETERELRRKAEARATAASQERTAVALQQAAPEFLHEFQQLEILVSRLHREVGDLTPNALAKSLAEIQGRCGQCASHFRPPPPYAVPQPGRERASPQTPVAVPVAPIVAAAAALSGPSPGAGPAPLPVPPPVQMHQPAPMPQQQQQQHHILQQPQQFHPQHHHHSPPQSAHGPHGPHGPAPMPPQMHAGHPQDAGGHPVFIPHGPPMPMSQPGPQGAAHLAPMKTSGSSSPVPGSAMSPRENHSIHSPRASGLPTPSEQPYESPPFEHKRSTPVTINQLLQQPAVAPAPSLPPKSPQYDVARSPHTPMGAVVPGGQMSVGGPGGEPAQIKNELQSQQSVPVKHEQATGLGPMGGHMTPGHASPSHVGQPHSNWT